MTDEVTDRPTDRPTNRPDARAQTSQLVRATKRPTTNVCRRSFTAMFVRNIKNLAYTNTHIYAHKYVCMYVAFTNIQTFALTPTSSSLRRFCSSTLLLQPKKKPSLSAVCFKERQRERESDLYTYTCTVNVRDDDDDRAV